MKVNKDLKALTIITLMCFGFSSLLEAKSSGPDTKLTGGFDELTCRQCHSSYQLNTGRTLGGHFEIVGIPEEYEGGKSYMLMLQIAHPNRSNWGFELSVRSASDGGQAGKLIAGDSKTLVIQDGDTQYITQSGTAASERISDRANFPFVWVAPEVYTGMVIFNATGNAADSNGKPTGDYIYTASAFSNQQKDVSEISEVDIGQVEIVTIRRLKETPIPMNLPAPVDLAKGNIEFHIQHRFFQSLEDSEPGNAFGIDSGANINLGLNYAVTKELSLGISRARIDQIISLQTTYEIHTRSESWWKMALHGGVAGKDNFERQYSPFLQLATSFDYKMLRLNLVPTMVFNSRDESLVQQQGPDAINPDENHTFSLGIGADVALHRRFSIVGEYVPRLAGFGGFTGKRSQFGGGVAIRTWGHVFTILVSRSRDLSPTKYAVGADSGDVSLGFNIYSRVR